MTVWFSLRRRLLTRLLCGVTALWLAMLLWSYIDAHHEIDELFDAQLAQAGQALLAQGKKHWKHSGGGDDDHELAEAVERAAHPYQRAMMFQLWASNGRLLARSLNAPETPLAGADGFTETHGANGHWRYFSQWDRHRRLRVQVAENHAVRNELIGHIAWRLLLPALLGVPLLGAWIWLATRRALAPLDAVAAQIAGLAPGHLQPVAPATAPTEIRPLLDALNNLFGRVDAVIANERRFTADAAHELRTPLAAIAAQAQVAARARDDDERTHALAQLAAGTMRAARLVEQLLILARLDPEQGIAAQAVPTRLDLLAGEVCAAHGAKALDKGIALELDAREIAAAVHADLLRILLRNLVDNAIRYTPPGGRVVVRVDAGGGGVRLHVADNGPGIPAAERARMLERFSRLAGQDEEGSGLGLSIVRRIAELHGATLVLETGDDGRGLTVEVTLPATGAGGACPPGTS